MSGSLFKSEMTGKEMIGFDGWEVVPAFVIKEINEDFINRLITEWHQSAAEKPANIDALTWSHLSEYTKINFKP
jgi:hypothetical protein